MKKGKLFIGLVSAFVLSATMLVGCGGTDTPPAEETNDDAEAITFIVGYDDQYPPYGFVDDDGNVTGFDIELAQEVCNRNGWEFEADVIPWDAKDALLDSGAISCIWNGFTMEGREDLYTFSDPYMKNGQVVVVKADSGITDLAGLEGKNVLTQVASAAYDVLNGEKADVLDTFSLETRDTYNTAFTELETGAYDAVACDLSIAEYQLAKNPGTYVVLEETLADESYAVGFKPGNDEMATTVSETLKAMNDDGFVEKLCEKYAEYGISYENWMIK